jgi:hypothetical protein
LPQRSKRSAQLSNAEIAVDKLWGREVLYEEITQKK